MQMPSHIKELWKITINDTWIANDIRLATNKINAIEQLAHAGTHILEHSTCSSVKQYMACLATLIHGLIRFTKLADN